MVYAETVFFFLDKEFMRIVG